MTWQMTLLRRLQGGLNSDGSHGYGYRSRGAAEPTALATMALAARGEDAGPGRQWLARQQRPDGGVPVLERLEGPCWPTPLALLAWEDDPSYDENAEHARQWLRRAHGNPAAQQEVLGHDTTLVAWSWTEGTHSWVEPTSHALLALHGDAQTDRTEEAVRLLINRCLPDGGWNYGNTVVLGNILRPFPATTGVVLAALAGRPEVLPDDLPAIERSKAWLRTTLEGVRAPLSLGWGLIGLARWNASPEAQDEWLSTSVTADVETDPVHDALRLLAVRPGVLRSSLQAPAEEPPAQEGDEVGAVDASEAASGALE